ncbi:Antibiotic biosynthesis monooxygenase [Brevundimonas diminuta 3F5N]|uniref:Antibiotic biosynthesis monooxygenase n=1 Tax=Brevundimonas diminuta 3F5N TaxID=1255603 RepID=A0A1R4GDN9_BREDI|nr:putative quinol monooxygenase [Brevundimonas diminuta]SJM66266.1 Antibiotic biosynthesis monooxygenase [Brevundimonas diminuta 3F5N]
MAELFITVGLRAKAGKEDALRQDLIAVAQTSRTEDGALRYELFEDSDQPGLFVFFEHWASEEAQSKHHNDGPHIQHFQANGAANVEKMEFFHRLERRV